MTQLQFTDIQGTPKIIRAAEIQIELPSTPLKYYRHGWQSWSLAAWTDVTPFPMQKPVSFHPYQTDAVYAREPNPHGSWLGAVEFEDGNILLLGALATDTHVFLLQNQLTGRSEADEVEWFIAYGSESKVFDEYVQQLGIRFGMAVKDHVPRVWCSWYSLYLEINEKILHQVFDGLGDLPFDVLQVDDGWQKDIGDWEANEKFPSGMAALAEKIKSTGRRAGLWLAPLLVAKSSQLFREHHDWLLKDEKRNYISPGFNYWGQDLFALDVSHPDVILWLEALMKQVRSWGFDYFKLDFLYGGAMKGRRHVNMPREAAYRQCLISMRKAMGEDAFLLTCGTPILPALGACDAIRIGPDVSYEWENRLYEYLLQNFSTPSIKNAIRTVVNRLWLKPLIHVDPDVEYFAAKENTLEEEHKEQLRDLALLCDFKATSDLPQWLTVEERELLRSFLNAEPKVSKLSRYKYALDNRIIDFSSAIEFTKQPKGFYALLGEIMGWGGNLKPVIQLILTLDTAAKKRRASRI
ncbi:MAG: alpha-galactosidase [Chloroflexi bacterium]|nr:alpha-galactosidase [Chloroflexota bacterium]